MPQPLDDHQQFTFDPDEGASGAYITEAGKPVAAAVILSQLFKVLKGLEGEMIEISQQLIDSEITLQEWYDAMSEKKRISHNLAGALVVGGVILMSDDDFDSVADMSLEDIARQDFNDYESLDNFALAIAAGLPLGKGFLNRVRLHIKAGKTTFHRLKGIIVEKNGFNEERRVLGSTLDHCRTLGGHTGCVEWADMGWQPLGSTADITDSPCMKNCLCHKEFRRVPAGPIAQRLIRDVFVNLMKANYDN